MVSPPELEIPSAIVLNGTEQPQSATAEPGSYSNNGAGSGLGLALGAPSSSSPANGGLDAPSQPGAADGSHSRLASRRASFQSKELSEMELPDPSWLSQARGQRQLSVNATSTAPQTADGLLTTSDNAAATTGYNQPVVHSIPSSPYTGSGAWSPSPGSQPKFGDTSKYEELVARLEALSLPEPEALTSGSKRDDQEKEKILKELQDVIAEMDLPEPEYIQKYVLRSQGAKTPEPQTQQPGEAMSPKVARATSIKRANGRNGVNGEAH